MRLPIHLQQLRRVHMGVPLGRPEPGVSEQFLNSPQIGAALQQVCGE
jgi:hypothetical protein